MILGSLSGPTASRMGEPEPPGDFLKAFADAVLRADALNYAYLKPALVLISNRFPKYKCHCGEREA